nr:TraR/DksA C4-type zinc finger protein [Caldovatus aquaticus]
MARIAAALARIESGEYGWCARCGEPIAPGRLAPDPALPTCVACAGQAGGG